MAARLTLDDDGMVWLIEPETEESDGRIERLGHVDDDGRCPDGMDDAWAGLASRWGEEVEEARAERALWRAEYDDAIGGMRA